MKRLNIVIADDAEMFSRMLRGMLSAIVGFHIVGTATNGVEAVRLVEELKPHVLILDVSMPVKDGIAALKEIRRVNNSTLIIMFTGHSDSLIRKTCLEAGADYFLDKSQVLELIEICEMKLLAG